MSFPLRCHHCHRWIGESRAEMELVGLFKNSRDARRVDGPRDTWQCKGCSWINIFRPAVTENASQQAWRAVELKQGNG